MDTLFAWIHLSDLQIGHDGAAGAAAQKLVLAALRKDIADQRVHLQPDALLVTGDIAWSGAAAEYAEAWPWLATFAEAAGVPLERIYVVPGDRDVRTGTRDAELLVDALRHGKLSLDDALEHDQHHLISRLREYLAFASRLAPKCGDLFWVDHLAMHSPLRLRLVGLNTVLLAAGDEDRGKLRLGGAQIQPVMEPKPEVDLILVLSHHPFRGRWLADENDVDAWLSNHAHLHLFSDVEKPDVEQTRSGAGSHFVRIGARSAYCSFDRRAAHGYSIGGIIQHDDGSVVVRVWPRQWSNRNKGFRKDVDILPDEKPYVEHQLKAELAVAAHPVISQVPEVSGAQLAVVDEAPWERFAPGFDESDQAYFAGVRLWTLGRLAEAAGLLRLGLKRHIAQKDWQKAADDAANLSTVLQARGELADALAQAQESIRLANEARDASGLVGMMASLAAALHAMGLWTEAAAAFEEAERKQKENDPRAGQAERKQTDSSTFYTLRESADPLLYGLSGFQYCDLLLDRGRHADVRERAELTLTQNEGWYSLLDIALDHVSLGRAHFLAAQSGVGGGLAQAAHHLQQAVDRLRRAAEQEYLPLGLLAHAEVHTYTGNFEEARRDLAEALTLASRSGFRLHEVDAHLGYARLYVAEADPAQARPHLAQADALITSTGYHRRDEDLAHLEAEECRASFKLKAHLFLRCRRKGAGRP